MSVLLGGGGWAVEGPMCGRDKDTSADFAQKFWGVGAYVRGGAYLWDTTVLVNS